MASEELNRIAGEFFRGSKAIDALKAEWSAFCRDQDGEDMAAVCTVVAKKIEDTLRAQEEQTRAMPNNLIRGRRPSKRSRPKLPPLLMENQGREEVDGEAAAMALIGAQSAINAALRNIAKDHKNIANQVATKAQSLNAESSIDLIPEIRKLISIGIGQMVDKFKKDLQDNPNSEIHTHMSNSNQGDCTAAARKIFLEVLQDSMQSLQLPKVTTDKIKQICMEGNQMPESKPLSWDPFREAVSTPGLLMAAAGGFMFNGNAAGASSLNSAVGLSVPGSAFSIGTLQNMQTPLVTSQELAALDNLSKMSAENPPIPAKNGSSPAADLRTRTQQMNEKTEQYLKNLQQQYGNVSATFLDKFPGLPTPNTGKFPQLPTPLSSLTSGLNQIATSGTGGLFSSLISTAQVLNNVKGKMGAAITNVTSTPPTKKSKSSDKDDEASSKEILNELFSRSRLAKDYKDKDGNWSDEVIDLSWPDLSKFLKNCKFTESEKADLKLCRRRKKNRKYAQDSRAKKRSNQKNTKLNVPGPNTQMSHGGVNVRGSAYPPGMALHHPNLNMWPG
eukprot:m.53098 g.53098  ORF g.53098 m.53098 type:complete len:559 (+) comp10841_c0_seq1:1025-2701(+)